MRAKAQYFWMPKEKPGATLADSVEWFWDEGYDTPAHGPFQTKSDAKRDRREYVAKGTGGESSSG